MTFSKVLTLVVLLAVSCSCYDSGRNDVSSENRKGGSDYDHAFLDEILGPNYFDEMDPVPKKVNQNENTEIIVTEKALCLGCPQDVTNTKDPKIHEIAQFAFSTYSSSSDGSSSDPAPFVRVIKASTQVVAGVKYILQIEVGQYNCSKSKYQENPEECIVDESKDNVICDFEVLEQSWIKMKKVLMSQCRGSNDIDTDDQTTTSYDDFSDGNEIGTTQQDELVDNRRRRRETSGVATTRIPSLYGRIGEANENKETINDMAKFSIQQLDVIDEDNDARMLIEVLNVKKQIVSGWLYHLKIRVAQTSCREGEEVTMEKCKSKIILPFTICNMKVLFQPWQTVQKKVTESQCFPEKMKKSKKVARKLFPDSDWDYSKKNKNYIEKNRIDENGPLIGGPTVIQPDSPELQSLVHWAINSLDAKSNALHAQKLVTVVHAERQLVSGILTKLVIETGYTDCRKSPGLDKSKCVLDEAREHQFCSVTVWEKPWLNEKRMTESKCGKSEEIVKRKKREIEFTPTISKFDKNLEQQFGVFIQEYDKKYATPEEYTYRLGVFHENSKKIKLLQENEEGTAIYGATMFADLTDEEFSQHYLGLRPDLRQSRLGKQAKIPQVPKLPDEFDWKHFNAVTPVKNQGSCGSCWAFSVTGNIEGLYARKHNTLVSFSEQELVDCDTLDSGCGGGLPENAYRSIQKLGGLEAENNYPYDGKNEKCHFKSELAQAKVTGFVEISKNETEMAAWLYKNGPISIGINANAMQFYFGGVSKPWKFLCSPKTLDHGVLITGFGVHRTKYTKKDMPYWAVKNSWGPHWGEQGYYLVYRGEGVCGLNQMATSAVIA